MPKNISLFEKCWYASIVVGLLFAAIVFYNLSNDPSILDDKSVFPPPAALPLVIAVWQILGIGLVLIIWLIARKRLGWVRVVLVVLFIILLPTAILSIVSLFAQNVFEFDTLTGLLGSLQIALQAIGLMFLFTGDAPAWFKKQAAAT